MDPKWVDEAVAHLCVVREMNPRPPRGVLQPSSPNQTLLLFAPSKERAGIVNSLVGLGIEILGQGHDAVNSFFTMIVRTEDRPGMERILEANTRRYFASPGI